MAKKGRKLKGGKKQVRDGKDILEESVEQFMIKQIEEYIRLHKEHEKDLKYIG